MPKWTDAQMDQVLELSRADKSIRQIAETTGISKSSIGLFLKSQKPPALEIQEVNVPETTQEINMSDTIETGMIDEGTANNFLTGLGSSPQGLSVRPIGIPQKGSAFIEGLINTRIPEAQHITTPFKSRSKKMTEPKTPKPVAERKVVEFKEPEDVSKKPDLIAKITFNVNTFDALLGDILRGDKEGFLKSLDKMGIAVLEATLKTIETTRSIKNLTNQFMHFFYIGTTMVEIGSQQYLGMKTQGFTQMLQQTQNDELKLIMQEMAMEQKDKFQKIQRPEVRLAMIMTTTLLAVNSQNNLLAIRQQQQTRQQPGNPSIQKPASQRTEEAQVNSVIPGQAKVSPVMPKDKEEDYKDL